MYPDKRLNRIAEPVTFENKDEIIKILRIMATSLWSQKYGDKLGLAAPQIGINKRIIVVMGTPMINPEWTPIKAPLEVFLESCYSVGSQIYRVERAKYGWAKWQDVDGNWREEKMKSTKAIVFQHELAHLNGKLCNEEGEEFVPIPSPTLSKPMEKERSSIQT